MAIQMPALEIGERRFQIDLPKSPTWHETSLRQHGQIMQNVSFAPYYPLHAIRGSPTSDSLLRPCYASSSPDLLLPAARRHRKPRSAPLAPAMRIALFVPWSSGARRAGPATPCAAAAMAFVTDGARTRTSLGEPRTELDPRGGDDVHALPRVLQALVRWDGASHG